MLLGSTFDTNSPMILLEHLNNLAPSDTNCDVFFVGSTVIDTMDQVRIILNYPLFEGFKVNGLPAGGSVFHVREPFIFSHHSKRFA